MPLYTFAHNLLTVLVQIANKMGLQKKNVIACSLVARERMCSQSCSLATAVLSNESKCHSVLFH
jgi:hypothetical protein